MILKNLNELGIEAKTKSLAYSNSETVLSSKFKTEFSNLLIQNSTDKIIFQEYTAVVTTSKGLKIILPNQWFYLASFFYDFLNSLWQYKEVVNEFEITSDVIKEIRGKEIPNEINILIEAKFEEIEDKTFFKEFLTNYDWWFGSKTIDRGDFFVSPVLKQAGVINETSSYIASIAYFLSLSNETQNLLSSPTLETISQDVNNVIYYGSPGTGKSHRADIETNGKEVQKVTFHPDYDYHSFVGGYKPTMDRDKIAYKFVPQIFSKIYVDAWKNLVSADETKPFYLQIEEINRGNCAEIFGDLFQLLDRDKDGFSKYEVTAEEELCKYLLSEKGFGGNHPGIENGKLRFPNNLKIIATMNTSDQSLFPMDSAFKRRWDWIYVPIDTDCKYSDFTIQLDNSKAFEWLSFLKVINEEIFEITKSQDKQIGNWFIDAQNSGKVISENTFVNKVLFYLWNDVFKDEENTIFKSADGKNLTYTSFFENGTSNNLVSYILEERLKLIDVNKAEPTTTDEE
jgi:hypothetical protein